MEAILSAGKSVITNYNYLKRIGISVIMAAVTAAVILSMSKPVPHEVSQEMMRSTQIVKCIESSIIEAERIATIFEEINYGKSSTTLEMNNEKKAANTVSEKNQTESKEENVPMAAEVSVTFYGNGGVPETFTETFEADAFDLSSVEAPDGNGKIFNGWFEDANCTIPFDGTVEEDELVLYAGWIVVPGYLCNNQGYTYGTNGLDLQDGLAVLPDNKACTGINAGTFSGVENNIYEIYIPSNITDIDMNAFESLPYLIYIEAEPGNPSYYAEDGLLYYSNGNIAFVPRMRR